MLRGILIGAASIALVGMTNPVLADMIFDNQDLGGDGFYNGTGIPDGDFVTDIASFGGGTVQLGLRARTRGGLPSPSNGNVYTFLIGGGSSPGLARWNYDFSVNLSATSLTIGDVTVGLTVFDKNTGITTDLDAILPDNAELFSTGGTFNGGHTTKGDVSGSVVGIQNSENLGFGGLVSFAGFDASSIDDYVFTLSVTDKADSSQTASVQMQVDAVPEPASMALLGTALLGFGGIGWRRRRKA